MRRRSSLLVGLVGVFRVGTKTVDSIKRERKRKREDWPYSSVRITCFESYDDINSCSNWWDHRWNPCNWSRLTFKTPRR